MKSYTDLEQSRKLADILPIESADMYYFDNLPVPKVGYSVEVEKLYSKANIDYIPCWSLAALLGVIKPINENTYTIRGTIDGGAIISFDEITIVMFQEEEIIDAVFKMVIWLKKNNRL